MQNNNLIEPERIADLPDSLTKEHGAAEGSSETPPDSARESVSVAAAPAATEEDFDTDAEHPADLADRIEHLPLNEQVNLLNSLPTEHAADALVEMDESSRVELMEQLDTNTAATLIGEMSPDDAADILDELKAEQRDTLLQNLELEDAEEIRTLMAFGPETAGAIMNTEIVVLKQELSVDEAIKVVRQDIEDKEIPYYAYLVDGEDHLTGVLSLRDLLTLPRGTVLKEASRGNIIFVTFDQERNEVARMFSDYNFMALPVVDHEGRILGIITHDDVIDLINELATEDMLGMVGAGQDESVDTSTMDSVKMRLPWLLVNMCNSALAALMVYMFEGSIAAMPILAVFMPMVANQAGNTGQQALAVIIRQLALEKLDKERSFMAIRREVRISLCNGFLLAILVWLGVYLVTGIPLLSTLMVLALVMDMFLGALAGASIPLLLKKLGRDPAQASSIFLTAITDGAGFFIFLGLVTLFLL